MTPPFSLVLIKPMTIRRDHGPRVLADILERCPVVLRKFRQWTLCDTTITALGNPDGQVLFPPGKRSDSWVCLFTHIDRVTDPTNCINEVFGNPSFYTWIPGQIRHKYGGFSNYGNMAHPADNVAHISDPSRVELEAKILFKDFDVANL